MKIYIFIIALLSTFCVNAQVVNKQEQKSGVTAGTYTNAAVTVNEWGKVTNIVAGTATNVSYGWFESDEAAKLANVPKKGEYFVKNRNRYGLLGGTRRACFTCN